MKAAKVDKTGTSFDQVIAIIRKAIPRLREMTARTGGKWNKIIKRSGLHERL